MQLRILLHQWPKMPIEHSIPLLEYGLWHRNALIVLEHEARSTQFRTDVGVSPALDRMKVFGRPDE
jgi:hypothetical protein